MFPNEEFDDELETDIVAFADPRSLSLGARILCSEESLDLDESITRIYNHEEYHLYRETLGIPEASIEIDN